MEIPNTKKKLPENNHYV